MFHIVAEHVGIGEGCVCSCTQDSRIFDTQQSFYQNVLDKKAFYEAGVH
jgi:hypothetical protein